MIAVVYGRSRENTLEFGSDTSDSDSEASAFTDEESVTENHAVALGGEPDRETQPVIKTVIGGLHRVPRNVLEFGTDT